MFTASVTFVSNSLFALDASSCIFACVNITALAQSQTRGFCTCAVGTSTCCESASSRSKASLILKESGEIAALVSASIVFCILKGHWGGGGAGNGRLVVPSGPDFALYSMSTFLLQICQDRSTSLPEVAHQGNRVSAR